MARRGKYGQLPSAAPSLTNTIISIARQMQSDREQNLMDAWKNGGSFEGKPVTDAMVLAFWQDRLKDVDKADPLYDTYHNTLTQTEYSIAESKMSTWYAQSKGDATADRRMASFYSTWSNKIPKDSEFFRVLQRDSAQFIRSALAKDKAAAGGSGGGGGRGKGGLTKAQLKAKAYNDAQAKTYTDHEQLGAFLTNVLTSAAQGRGLIGLGSAQDLTKFDPSDPTAMMQVLDQISHHPDAVVYYTAQGAITGKAITDVIKTIDPHFDGKLTVDYYGKALSNQVVGQANRLDLATSTGHKADMKSLAKTIKSTNELGRETNAWPIEKSYQNLRNDWLRTWQDPTATPDQKMAAWGEYQKGLVALATSKTRPPDQNTYSRIMAEATGNGTVDSLAENFSGQKAADHSSVNGAPTGDIADTHASVANLFAQQQAVATGQAVWAVGTTGSDGVFHPGAGVEVGAASAAAVQAASPEGAVQLWVTQTGSKPIPVWVAGKTVTAKVVDANGFTVGATNPDAQKVATAYDVSIDGQSTRLYAYTSPDGHTIYTTDAPWGGLVDSHDTGGSIQLTVRLNMTPSEDTVGNNPNFTVTKDENGKVTNITVDPARFVLTSTDPVRYAAGVDPHTDSLSPSIALHLGSSESRAELADLQKDPGFQHTVDTDLRLAAGGQFDPTSGTVIGGDPAIYNEGAAQVDFSYRMNDPRAYGMGPAGGEVFFGRNNTRGAFDVTGPVFNHDAPPASLTPARIGIGAVAAAGAQSSGVLPSDAARGTAFNGLASFFQPGTNRIQPPQTTSQDGITLVAPQQLRVPQAPRATAATPTGIPPQASPATSFMQPAPGPTAKPADSITPTPIPPAPTPVAAASAGFGSQDTVASGVTATPATPSLPQPLAPRTGQRPV